ncbi:MAG: 6-phosphofructokinase [Treponema sp.]|nr:6-phosphofructokinase [Treponema sp.]
MNPERNCIFVQSGGPTSVINASAAGVIKTALLNNNAIPKVYAASYGIKGILNHDIYDISLEDRNEIDLLLATPGAVFGTSRYKLKPFEEDDSDYRKVLDVFRKLNIRYLFYNGGNDSMDTCSKLNRYMKNSGYDCTIMGIPKTVDNDLEGTDHCPGFGSAAKFISTTVMEMRLDAASYDTGMVIIMEIMGRNTGWLTAASALGMNEGLGPDLVYLPEKAFSINKFIDDVNGALAAKKVLIVTVSEGIKDNSGHYIADLSSERIADSFGHKQLGGVATILGGILKEKINTRVRSMDIILSQRCAAHCASETDVRESFIAGKSAVEYALQGKSGFMVGFERANTGPYKCDVQLVNVENAANREKKVPLDWITSEGNGITGSFFDYAFPLIQGEQKLVMVKGLPRFSRLKKIKVSF